MQKNRIRSALGACLGLALAWLSLISVQQVAARQSVAPLIPLDPSADIAGVFAFVTQGTNLTTYIVVSNIFVTNRVGNHWVTNTQLKHYYYTNYQQYLTVALQVHPFEEPGGANGYRFDDNVVYVIYVSTNHTDLAQGRADLGYQFRFQTSYQYPQTLMEVAAGVITNVGDVNQNMVQTYTITKVDLANGGADTYLGGGIVPPNNQGISTPLYNQGDNGNNPAQSGAVVTNELDVYTSETVTNLSDGYTAFAGQRDDAFFGDTTAFFDLLSFRNPGLDTHGGFNVHTMVLNIPLQELGGPQAIVGVYAATYRQSTPVLHDGAAGPSISQGGPHVQVAREGNPLFSALFLPISVKNMYERTSPTQDATLFANDVLNPQLAVLFNLVFPPEPDTETNRTDLETIFIPDLIKVDLSTGPARLAGGQGVQDDAGFSPLSAFGGDMLVSTIQTNNGGVIPGGWPNGRRFGDDVMDIALIALQSNLRTSPPIIRFASDYVLSNDMSFNKVFPYAATPQNGRNHFHSK